MLIARMELSFRMKEMFRNQTKVLVVLLHIHLRGEQPSGQISIWSSAKFSFRTKRTFYRSQLKSFNFDLPLHLLQEQRYSMKQRKMQHSYTSYT